MNIASPSPDSKPTFTDDQALFLMSLDMALDADEPELTQLRLTGGPGTGKSFTLAEAASRAETRGWVTFLVGPTHQATGVLASAVPIAYPFEPEPRSRLSGGDVMYCTAHRLGSWVRKARSRGAAAGEADPIPRDSWLGRAFGADWDRPPQGCLLIVDEMSMFTGQMVDALRATAATLQRECERVVFVVAGDQDQLTPVRGANYVLTQGETPESPSPFVVDPGFDTFALSQNVRAKSPMIKKVIADYKAFRTIPIPDPQRSEYRWVEATPEMFESLAETIKQETADDTPATERTICLGYRRATVANANHTLSLAVNGAPAHELHDGILMRVQETYSPADKTLAASSDLAIVEAVEDVTDDILSIIMPPKKGHRAAHDPQTVQRLRDFIDQDMEQHGPYPVARVRVKGDRAGLLSNVPVQVTTESDMDTPTQGRWRSLESLLTYAAFRVQHENQEVRRGLAAVYYHLVDSAKLKLEPPFAMTSHRAQGSTYAHVVLLADQGWGQRLVDHRIASARDASAYVMLSRAAETLTVAWKPRNPDEIFSF